MNRSMMLLIIVGVSCIAAPFTAAHADKPIVPAKLMPPESYKLLLKAEAKGVQIWESVPGDDGKPKWNFVAPLADLFDERGKKLGCHYAGPSWEAADGSKVKKPADAKLESLIAPNKDDLPWLLIPVLTEDGKNGTFAKATYIQRLNTKGGQAPKDPPLRIGTKIGVPYTATYYFYSLE